MAGYVVGIYKYKNNVSSHETIENSPIQRRDAIYLWNLYYRVHEWKI